MCVYPMTLWICYYTRMETRAKRRDGKEISERTGVSGEFSVHSEAELSENNDWKYFCFLSEHTF